MPVWVLMSNPVPRLSHLPVLAIGREDEETLGTRANA